MSTKFMNLLVAGAMVLVAGSAVNAQDFRSSNWNHKPSYSSSNYGNWNHNSNYGSRYDDDCYRPGYGSGYGNSYGNNYGSNWSNNRYGSNSSYGSSYSGSYPYRSSSNWSLPSSSSSWNHNHSGYRPTTWNTPWYR